MNDSGNQWHYFKRASRPRHDTAPGDSGRTELFGYLVAIFLLGCLAAAGILGWQIYGYLRYGTWPALSVIGVLQWLNLDWARSPRDWTGLHEFLDALPVSVVAFVGGIFPVGIWLSQDGRSGTQRPLDWGE